MTDLLPALAEKITEQIRLALDCERREVSDWIDAYAKSEGLTIAIETPTTEERIGVLCTLLSAKAAHEKEQQIRLERAAALERGYTQGYADGEEGYGFDRHAWQSDSDRSAFEAHDAETRDRALEEAAQMSDDVATVRGESNYKVLAAAIRALKRGSK